MVVVARAARGASTVILGVVDADLDFPPGLGGDQSCGDDHPATRDPGRKCPGAASRTGRGDERSSIPTRWYGVCVRKNCVADPLAILDHVVHVDDRRPAERPTEAPDQQFTDPQLPIESLLPGHGCTAWPSRSISSRVRGTCSTCDSLL